MGGLDLFGTGGILGLAVGLDDVETETGADREGDSAGIKSIGSVFEFLHVGSLGHVVFAQEATLFGRDEVFGRDSGQVFEGGSDGRICELVVNGHRVVLDAFLVTGSGGNGDAGNHELGGIFGYIETILVGFEVGLGSSFVDAVRRDFESGIRNDRHLQFDLGFAAVGNPFGFKSRRVDTGSDQHLQLTHRDGRVLEVFFELEHHAPLEGFTSIEPGIVIGLVEGRVREEAREGGNVGLGALVGVFLGSRLTLDGIEALLGFLHQTGADSIQRKP